jgi:hypothetical protein
MFCVEQWFAKVHGRQMNLTKDFRKLHVTGDYREKSLQDLYRRKSLWSSRCDCFCISRTRKRRLKLNRCIKFSWVRSATMWLVFIVTFASMGTTSNWLIGAFGSQRKTRLTIWSYACFSINTNIKIFAFEIPRAVVMEGARRF